MKKQLIIGLVAITPWLTSFVTENDCEEEISQLQETIDHLKSELSVLQGNFDTQSYTYLNLEDKHQKLKFENNQLTKANQELQAEVSELKQRLETPSK